eukprot:TRINITY_DN29551_c0_g1_i2.p1 TRINITY_DN29551_c0_g1~~TRINITY_DN29551_c0_g1_i2.p1  ORF type:complete len:705 (+),score=156.48 TRINITY_DN29551_c0_g1_i2:80-2194(+)
MQDSSSSLWGDDGLNTNGFYDNGVHDDVKWSELGHTFLRPVSAPPQLQHLPPPPSPSPLPHAPTFLHYAPLVSAAPAPSFGSLTTPTTPNDNPMAQSASSIAVGGHSDAYRFSSEYYAYYYSQRPIDPRLPPPLSDAPRPWASSSGASSGIIAPAPSNPTVIRHSQTSSLASRLLSSQDIDEPEPIHSGFSSSNDYRLGSATSWKSPLEMIQSDFPRTSSPMFNPLNSSSMSTNTSQGASGSRFATTGGLSLGTSVIGSNERRYSLDGGESLRRTGSNSSLSEQMSGLSFHDKVEAPHSYASESVAPVIGLRSISPMVGGLPRPSQPIAPPYAGHGDSWSSKAAVPQPAQSSRYKEPAEIKTSYKSGSSGGEDWDHHENQRPAGRGSSRQGNSSGRGNERKNNKKRGTTPTNPSTASESNSPRSDLLQELRSSKNGHSSVKIDSVIDRQLVQEFATDQNGSRFIQQSLETANADEKNALFEQLEPVTLRLCVDVFGNYVIQKFFEFGLPSHRRILAEKLIGNVLTLALHMYGCRVIQKALEVIGEDQQILLVQELEGHVIKCVKDQNGNHVVQKCIEKVPPQHIDFIVHAFKGQVYSLSTHSYGCRVVQRLLEYCTDEQKTAILEEVFSRVMDLVTDQYGNYVIQHILQKGALDYRSAIIAQVRGNVLTMSKHKFASNVIEKCFAFSTTDEKSGLVDEMVGDDK